MPGFDGTGPLGLGPMMGMGMGYCVLKVEDETKSPELRPMTASGAEHLVVGHMIPAPRAGHWSGVSPGAYSPALYAPRVLPYGYGAGYVPVWHRPFGWLGRGLGRGWSRGFGGGRARGRGWFGW